MATATETAMVTSIPITAFIDIESQWFWQTRLLDFTIRASRRLPPKEFSTTESTESLAIICTLSISMCILSSRVWAILHQGGDGANLDLVNACGGDVIVALIVVMMSCSWCSSPQSHRARSRGSRWRCRRQQRWWTAPRSPPTMSVSNSTLAKFPQRHHESKLAVAAKGVLHQGVDGVTSEHLHPLQQVSSLQQGLNIS